MDDNFVWNSIRLWKCQKCYFHGVKTIENNNSMFLKLNMEFISRVGQEFWEYLKYEKSGLVRVKEFHIPHQKIEYSLHTYQSIMVHYG